MRYNLDIFMQYSHAVISERQLSDAYTPETPCPYSLMQKRNPVSRILS